MIRRRTLVALPFLVCPGLAGARAAEIVAADSITLADVTVPAGRARVVAIFPLGAATASALSFAADLPEGERDLLAVAAGGKVLALEVLAWRGKNGSRLLTRLSTVPDRQRLRLERMASAPHGHGYRHEEWTDYLAWQGEAPMADAPVRPVLAGTWQASLAAQRAGTRAMLVGGLHGVAPALLAACPPPCFSS